MDVKEVVPILRGLLTRGQQLHKGDSFRHAIEHAIACVNKQIPGRPLKLKNDIVTPFNDTIGMCNYRCPDCGKGLSACEANDIYNYGLDFCRGCGKHIDWTRVRGQITWYKEDLK